LELLNFSVDCGEARFYRFEPFCCFLEVVGPFFTGE